MNSFRYNTLFVSRQHDIIRCGFHHCRLDILFLKLLPAVAIPGRSLFDRNRRRREVEIDEEASPPHGGGGGCDINKYISTVVSSDTDKSVRETGACAGAVLTVVRYLTNEIALTSASPGCWGIAAPLLFFPRRQRRRNRRRVLRRREAFK